MAKSHSGKILEGCGKIIKEGMYRGVKCGTEDCFLYRILCWDCRTKLKKSWDREDLRRNR